MNELGEFHHAEEKPDWAKMIVAVVAIAILLIGTAGYIVESGMIGPGSKSAGQQYPRGL